MVSKMNCISATQAYSLIQFVLALNGEPIAHKTAIERLRKLAELLPEVKLDLAWDIDRVSDCVTYCVLATLNGDVLSISAVKHGNIPWPLRGATEVSEGILVTVNGFALTVASAISVLDSMWIDRELMSRVIDSALLAKEIEKVPVEISEDELAEAARRFYLAKGLREPHQRERWLQQRGLSDSRFQEQMRYLVSMEKTEKRLVGDRFQEQLGLDPSEYSGFRLAEAVIPDAFLTLVESTLQTYPANDLFQLIGRIAWETDYRHVFKVEFTERLRCELAEESRALLDSPVGSMRLVRTTRGDTCLVQLLGRESQVSQDVLERRIVRHLVRFWYEDMRRRARIEWNWGKAGAGTTF
jgi:putative peptide maturation system protein